MRAEKVSKVASVLQSCNSWRGNREHNGRILRNNEIDMGGAHREHMAIARTRQADGAALAGW